MGGKRLTSGDSWREWVICCAVTSVWLLSLPVVIVATNCVRNEHSLRRCYDGAGACHPSGLGT